jgi:two-component Ni(II)/redox sensor kinase NrsS
MSANRSPAPALLWRARLRLAALSLLVMGTILYGAGFSMARLLLQERETSLRRELQTVAGTLHDSLKPSLPQLAIPPLALAAVAIPSSMVRWTTPRAWPAFLLSPRH